MCYLGISVYSSSRIEAVGSWRGYTRANLASLRTINGTLVPQQDVTRVVSYIGTVEEANVAEYYAIPWKVSVMAHRG